MERKGGLGKGLGALIPGVTVGGPRLDEILVDAIAFNPRQPRSGFDEDGMADLTASVRELGVLQPIVVRACDGGYELVMGERRLRAARAAGLSQIPAIIRETEDDELLRDALVENLHREDLNPLEEAAAYRQLLDDFGTTHEDLARRLGKTRTYITSALRLLALPAGVQRLVAGRSLSAGQARAILALGEPDLEERLAQRVADEGWPVRAIEELVRRHALGEAIDATGKIPKGASRIPAVPEKGLAAAAEALSDRLDTRARILMGRRKGRIVIEFGSREDLDRILGSLLPPGDKRR
ncbi:MAG: ParB/RepB/Spo0J family partition protein [Actinomycetota bacterium]